MIRATYYDTLAGCYKIRPDVQINQVQKLGRLEDMEEKLYVIAVSYKNGIKDAKIAITEILEALGER